MNTTVDIATDLRDCELLLIHKLNGCKLLIFVIPENAAVECTRCKEELARYHVIAITAIEEDDLIAGMCPKCYVRLIEYGPPLATIH